MSKLDSLNIRMKTAIKNAFAELDKLSCDELKELRYGKFRAMGRFIEG